VSRNISPGQLVLRLSLYYGVFLLLVVALLLLKGDLLPYLPFSGADALQRADIEVTETSVRMPRELIEGPRRLRNATPGQVFSVAGFLLGTLVTTILVMLPITWTYLATRYDAGPSKVFVRSLILLPICASTVVLLIQDSLALAFGLAALVAAVRFRVALPEPVDGIYIFAAICVGLAGGIGFMGVALVMSMVFTLTHAALWYVDYGRNPIDDARQDAAALKLAKKLRQD
jgi:hypothetical protein